MPLFMVAQIIRTVKSLSAHATLMRFVAGMNGEVTISGPNLREALTTNVTGVRPVAMCQFVSTNRCGVRKTNATNTTRIHS